MKVLKIQEAQLLLKKVLNDPRAFNLRIAEGEIAGSDEEVSFKFYKGGERGIFEVSIDGFTFANKTGEWNNAMIMLENTIKKMEREEEEERIEEALAKLKKYLTTG